MPPHGLIEYVYQGCFIKSASGSAMQNFVTNLFISLSLGRISISPYYGACKYFNRGKQSLAPEQV